MNTVTINENVVILIIGLILLVKMIIWLFENSYKKMWYVLRLGEMYAIYLITAFYIFPFSPSSKGLSSFKERMLNVPFYLLINNKSRATAVYLYGYIIIVSLSLSTCFLLTHYKHGEKIKKLIIFMISFESMLYIVAIFTTNTYDFGWFFTTLAMSLLSNFIINVMDKDWVCNILFKEENQNEYFED